MGDDAQALGGIIAFAVIFFVGILFFICALCSIEPARDTADAELSLARALAAYEALAAARAEAIRQSEQQAVKPPLPVHLPYFPYAASSETAECAICLEPLLTGHAGTQDLQHDVEEAEVPGGAAACSRTQATAAEAPLVYAICLEELRHGQYVVMLCGKSQEFCQHSGVLLSH
ncbi:hypothetical protein EJB05_45376, partial [Eragrostis curvula]